MNVYKVDVKVDYKGHNYRFDSMLDGIWVIDIDYGRVYMRIASNGDVAVNKEDNAYFSAIPKQDIIHAVNTLVGMVNEQIEEMYHE